MQSRSIKATLAAKVNVFVLFHFFHLLHRPRTWRTRAQAQGEEVPITDFADAPVFASPPELIPPTQVVQDYYDLAQRLRQLLSPICSWLESEDVQIVDTTAFSSGGSADTWRGLVRGLPVAIKSLRCYSSPEFDPAEVGIRFLKEIWVATQLSHPNIVPFLGVYSTPSHPFTLLYQMMDNLDLGRYLVEHPEVSRLKLLTEISRALRYMHSLDIIHGNVKMRNVLVDNDCVARLGGLGSAFSLSLPTSWFAPTAERLFCGIAPELIHPHAFGFVHARTTKATDVFAFGMLAWEVFAGRPPFSGKVEAAVILSVFKNDRPFRPDHPEVSDDVWTTIQGCWDRDPFQRLTAADVVRFLEKETRRTPSQSAMAQAILQG